MKSWLTTAVLSLFLAVTALGQQVQKKIQSRDLAVEVLPVLEFPLTIHEASLTRVENGYLLKCRLSAADESLLGLRYSLTAIDGLTGAHPITNRIEGFELAALDTKTIIFKTPIRYKPKDSNRIVVMFEQIVSAHSIWEVIKAKDVLEAYVKGDYSIQPHVLRVANQVDAPLQTRVIY